METGKGLILTILPQNKFIYKFCLSINLTLYLHITQIKNFNQIKVYETKTNANSGINSFSHKWFFPEKNE